MKKVFKVFFVSIIAISLSSCAVMFNGTSKRVSIISQTEGGEIYVNGLRVGTDNASVKLKRKRNHIIEVKKEGCKSQLVSLDKEFQIGWIFLYIFVNPFAIITDASTGAWNGFDKSTVIVPECSCSQ